MNVANRPSDPPLLSVVGLEKSFAVRRSQSDRLRRAPRQRVAAVDGVSFDVARGETLGIVGESGSGKSTLARCLIRLLRPEAGSIVFDGVDLAQLEGRSLREVRTRIQMIFQDPFTSLNPFLSIGDAILEAGIVHNQTAKQDGEQFVGNLLNLVGLPPGSRPRRPSELSGGQRQRVAIARALAVNPEVLIADEAVSSLDVSVQAQILNLFRELQDRLDLTIVFISHQLAVISHTTNTAAVMYLGRIVEYGSTDAVFRHPQHPYTRALFESHPEPTPALKRPKAAIVGELPSPLAIPSGCRFRTRCPYAQERCAAVDPRLETVGNGHSVACHVRPFA